ncbi:transcription initiation factor TFIID subunit 12 [Senna tora]|uniref:Transcription initiation factor TFIID subunit 12 n=1 Tax=Senna tora TaxID=362788 RepID=A0A834TB84_9FABA|nr:transcription initiation factor TFIID subunit 12 [Senna tora]
MEPQTPATTTSASSQSSEASQSQPPHTPVSLPPSSSSAPPPSASLHSSPNPNPIPNQPQNPNTKTTTPLPHPSAPVSSQPRPPSAFNRNLPPQQQSHYSHFSSPLSGSTSISGAPASRGGMAIGVPPHHPSPSPPFSSSFGQHFGGLGRTGVNISDSTSNSQVRTPSQGMGMLGSLGSSSQMRPGGMSAHQHRPVQSALRPPSAQNNQSSGSQSFQGHGLMRASSVGSPASPSISSSQGMQPLNQPWLSSGSPGKPPLPSPSFRQHPQSLTQRSHVPAQQHSAPTVSQQQQHQPLPSSQSQEHSGQQVPSSRPLHMPHQQQNTRAQGPGNQKPSSVVAPQPSAAQVGIQNRLSNVDADESCNRILSKRTIHELVNQVDPSEKLDPEVADILVDIAENFFESITKSGCSLAKHRKSTTLEAKDILLHLEKNWHMSLPGFGGDEIKSYRKQVTSDIHKERLASIKKSMMTNETPHAKGSSGQASGGAKGSLAKTPVNIFGSPTLKNS